MALSDSKSKVTVIKEPTNPYTGEKVTKIEIQSKDSTNKDTSTPVITLQPDSSVLSKKTIITKKKPNLFKRIFYSGWVSSQVFIITALTFTVALAWDNAFSKTFKNNIGLWLYPIILTLAVVIFSIISDMGINKIKKSHPTIKYYY